jgi:hypothetical protein
MFGSASPLSRCGMRFCRIVCFGLGIRNSTGNRWHSSRQVSSPISMFSRNVIEGVGLAAMLIPFYGSNSGARLNDSFEHSRCVVIRTGC